MEYSNYKIGILAIILCIIINIILFVANPIYYKYTLFILITYYIIQIYNTNKDRSY